MTSSRATIYAAGAVLWRYDGEKHRVLVIHRKRHDDWSFPKGKVDPGESLTQTAVREVSEETGYDIRLDAPMGYIEYTVSGGRPKEVHYWVSRVSEKAANKHTFVPNDEVDEQQWVTLRKARALLSYPQDRELLSMFVERVERRLERTFPVVLLRHAKATPPTGWQGPDETRPLSTRGLRQAEDVPAILTPYLPKHLITSTAVRCRETLAPLAEQLGRELQLEERLSQRHYDAGADDYGVLLSEVLGMGKSVVLCSHSPVMPELVAAIERLTKTKPGALASLATLATAEASVIHVARGKKGEWGPVVAVESLGTGL